MGATYLDLEAFEVDGRIARGLEVDMLGDDAVLYRQDALDQTSGTCAAFQVTNVGLQRPNENGILRATSFTQSLANRSKLSGVARLGSRAVALDECCLVGLEAGALIDSPDIANLGFRAGQGDTWGPPVLIHA